MDWNKGCCWIRQVCACHGPLSTDGIELFMLDQRIRQEQGGGGKGERQVRQGEVAVEDNACHRHATHPPGQDVNNPGT